MADTITIPREAVKALELALLGKPLSARNCTAAIRAVLTAWPGWEGSWTGDGDTLRRTIILPLPQEKQN